jgi:hypothetical protein
MPCNWEIVAKLLKYPKVKAFSASLQVRHIGSGQKENGDNG